MLAPVKRIGAGKQKISVPDCKDNISIVFGERSRPVMVRKILLVIRYWVNRL